MKTGTGNTMTKGNRTNHPSRRGVRLNPSKGGRTDRLEVRITPESKAALMELAKAAGVSAADLIEQWITEAGER